MKPRKEGKQLTQLMEALGNMNHDTESRYIYSFNNNERQD